MNRALRMTPLIRKSEPGRKLERVDDSLHALTAGWSKGRMIKASLIAGGLAALTASSAGISSLRRRRERAKGER
jgi:hypothetical protein